MLRARLRDQTVADERNSLHCMFALPSWPGLVKLILLLTFQVNQSKGKQTDERRQRADLIEINGHDFQLRAVVLFLASRQFV